MSWIKGSQIYGLFYNTSLLGLGVKGTKFLPSQGALCDQIYTDSKQKKTLLLEKSKGSIFLFSQQHKKTSQKK